MSSKNILVTGGTGSIGTKIVEHLLKNEHTNKVIIFNRDEIKQFLMQQDLEDDRVFFIMGDIRDYESLENVFERHKIDLIYHTAAMKHLVVCENEPIECSKTNIVGTHNLMKLSIKYDIPKVVTISTDKAASPTSVMGASKFIAERITTNANSLSKTQQRFCCVRFGNVANSRGSVIPIMIKRILDGKDIWISNPDVTRFIMRIDDAAKLVIKASEISQGGELFVLKMPSFKLGDLATVIKNRICPKLGVEIKINQKKLVTGEKVHEDLLNSMETKHLLENDKLYIVLHQNMSTREYQGFEHCKLENYNSSTAKLLSHDELENIILDHLYKHFKKDFKD